MKTRKFLCALPMSSQAEFEWRDHYAAAEADAIIKAKDDLLHEIKAECLYEKYAPATDLVQRLNRIYDKINAAITDGTMEAK